VDQNTLELIESLTEDALKMDGFDDCIIGVSERFGQPNHIVYDFDKVLKKLMSQGMTQHEAKEWYEFNMVGAYVGETTPSFLYVI
jgi:hypothetical protein